MQSSPPQVIPIFTQIIIIQYYLKVTTSTFGILLNIEIYKSNKLPSNITFIKINVIIRNLAKSFPLSET